MTTHKAWRHALQAHRGIDLGMIESTIAAARKNADIPPERIARTEDALSRSHALFDAVQGKGTRSAEYQYAMEVGQVAFERAQALEDLLALHQPTMTGRKAKRQREDAGFTSGETREAKRLPVWDEWQQVANAMHAKNPRLSFTAISDAVGEKFGVSGRAVRERVQIGPRKK